MTTGRPSDHVKELTTLVHRLLRRIERRKTVGEPVQLEEKQVSAIRWVVAEAARSQELREELRHATASLREAEEAAAGLSRLIEIDGSRSAKAGR